MTRLPKPKASAKTQAKKRLRRRRKPDTLSALFTIGYEQARPSAVLDELKRAKVKLLVDVRAVAASRKPGFSKRQIAASLDEDGIAYLHLQKLGTPAEGRQAARAGDRKALWRIYDQHMQKPEARDAMDELVALATTGVRLCLLCYCRNAEECHRNRIVEALQDRLKVTVEHLAPRLP